ncbi:EamA family transporter [Terriglobus sp. RCC_193]|uniref:EamA family transporter n=1 Tax=Terriglobus sp. RCC_193 TaxID=3239218 RepID=UPI0035240078
MTRKHESTSRSLVILAFACVYFFWGSTFVAIRVGVQSLSPAFVSGFRYCAAGVIMLTVLALRGVRVALPRAEFQRALLLGMVMLTGNNVMVSWAEQTLSAGLAALLAAAIPLLIALAETFIPGGTSLNRLGWVGTVLGFVGLVVLLAPLLQGGVGSASTGVVIMLVANLLWVAGSLYSGRRPSKIDPLLGAGWQMLLGGTLSIVMGSALGGWQTAHWSKSALLAVLWLIVFGSLVGYTAYMWLLHHVPVAKVATYAYVNPIVSVALSSVLLRESLHGSQWIAMAIILASVAVVTASKSTPKTA